MYTMEIYSAIKICNTHETENVVLNEVTQTQENKYSVCFFLMWDTTILKLIKTKVFRWE